MALAKDTCLIVVLKIFTKKKTFSDLYFFPRGIEVPIVTTDTVSSFDKNSKYLYQSTIAKISDNYIISKSKIASLIFS